MKVVKGVLLILFLLFLLGMLLIIYKKISNQRKSQEIINSRSVTSMGVSYQEFNELTLYKGKRSITFFLKQQTQATLVKKWNNGLEASKENLVFSEIKEETESKEFLDLETATISSAEGYGMKLQFDEPVPVVVPGHEEITVSDCDGFFFDMDKGIIYLSKEGVLTGQIQFTEDKDLRKQKFSEFIKELNKEFKSMEGLEK